MKIDITKLNKEIAFPIVQAQPIKKHIRFFSKVKDFFTFSRKYLLISNYILWSDYLQAYMFFPAPFLYDNASVPKLLGFAYKSDGMLLLGALPHDFSYRFQGLILIDDEGVLYFKSMSQKECDILLETLSIKESGLSKSVKLAKKILSLVGGFTYRAWVKKELDVSTEFKNLF